MKCHLCKRKFKDGEEVLEVMVFMEGERHGDFISNTSNKYVHLRHLQEAHNSWRARQIGGDDG